MVRRGRKILDGALKLLRPSEGAAPVDLADTTPLGYYQKVKASQKEISYGQRAATSKPGEIVMYATIPFAEGSDADPIFAKIGASKRAVEANGQTGLTVALMNLVNTEAILDAASELVGFVPATATVRVNQDGTTRPTSKLTNRPYTKRNGNSFTLPFGAGAAAADTDIPKGYKGMKAEIIQAVETGTANRSVSFKPEIY